MTDQKLINGLKIGVLNAIIRYQNSEYATKLINVTERSNSAVIKIPSNNLKKRVDSVNREYKKKQLFKQSKSAVTKCLIKMYDYEKFELEYFDLRFDLYAKELVAKKERFIKKYPGFEEKDFFKSEINYFENPESNRYFFNSKNHKIFYHNYLESDTHILDLHQNKKIDFLKEKLQNKSESDNVKTSQSQSQKQDLENNGYPPIFKSYECYQKFISLAEFMEIKLDNINARNNQAKLNGIWQSNNGQKLFLKHTEKPEYLAFLNKNYNSEFETRSMSSGKKYTNRVDEYLSSI
ncbi:hypothetical protein [Mesonia aestuariivivens]|uniref:Uncharacterized protein n=1 Tax=Mesonia aestuariivivens TaxID=2796128 RepID=A0ABS6VXU6_9FLAO|nr:hypothetical protein [Mesonia aestuariivivens]MBW2960414.1 hypothetical protein [Mesonia aestuariivivens]